MKVIIISSLGAGPHMHYMTSFPMTSLSSTWQLNTSTNFTEQQQVEGEIGGNGNSVHGGPFIQ